MYEWIRITSLLALLCPVSIAASQTLAEPTSSTIAGSEEDDSYLSTLYLSVGGFFSKQSADMRGVVDYGIGSSPLYLSPETQSIGGQARLGIYFSKEVSGFLGAGLSLGDDSKNIGLNSFQYQPKSSISMDVGAAFHKNFGSVYAGVSVEFLDFSLISLHEGGLFHYEGLVAVTQEMGDGSSRPIWMFVGLDFSVHDLVKTFIEVRTSFDYLLSGFPVINLNYESDVLFEHGSAGTLTSFLLTGDRFSRLDARSTMVKVGVMLNLDDFSF